ncbi:MAG: hypothetical protein NC937_04270, partial [Candidatus Omnitrophica bacterium]|nr:hypothetical protein [Candidatus Omnitrophota bacterium]
NMNGEKVYNFFSSGEDIVNNAPHGKAESIYASFDYAWSGQEKLKGRLTFGIVAGSNWCGWEFNKFDYGQWINTPDLPPIWLRMPPSEAKLIPPQQLVTKPFFLKSPSELFDTDAGKAKKFAKEKRFELLAKAIPARTFGIGGNKIDNIDNNETEIKDSFDMMTMKTGWYSNKKSKIPWKHSDFKNVAYLYTYIVFNNFVTLGGLK